MKEQIFCCAIVMYSFMVCCGDQLPRKRLRDDIDERHRNVIDRRIGIEQNCLSLDQQIENFWAEVQGQNQLSQEYSQEQRQELVAACLERSTRRQDRKNYLKMSSKKSSDSHTAHGA